MALPFILQSAAVSLSYSMVRVLAIEYLLNSRFCDISTGSLDLSESWHMD